MTQTSLTETLTPEEYDTLVALTAKADRLVKDRYADYIRATKGYGPKRGSDIEQITYKSRDADRTGRDPDGRYDIVVSYPDPYGENSYLPSSILWDPVGAIGKTLEAIEAERVELARIAAEAEAETLRYREERERQEAARLAKKYGYVKK